MKMRIGVPEGLLFERYEVWIRAFFDGLGPEIVYSGKRTKEQLELGLKGCVSEACLPVKAYYGQVADLAARCDFVAVPRLMQCEDGSALCPEICGLPEIVFGAAVGRIVFDSPLYLANERQTLDGLIREGRILGIPAHRIRTGYVAGKEAFRALQKMHPVAEKGHLPTCGNAALKSGEESMTEKSKGHRNRRIVLLGQEYLQRDEGLNLDVAGKLRLLGYEPVTGTELLQTGKKGRTKGKDSLGKQAYAGLMKKPYWNSLRESLKTAELIRKDPPAGVVYLSCFGCGVDSLGTELLQKRLPQIPYLLLKLDEHGGDAGVDTRLEAFTEMMERAGDMGGARRWS